jgi:hypothetical protein
MKYLIWLALLAGGCAAPKIRTVTLYERCAPFCAPFQVRFAAEDDDQFYCLCDGTKGALGPKFRAAGDE